MNDEEKIMEKRSSFRGWKERNKGRIPQQKIIIVISVMILFFSALIIYPYWNEARNPTKINAKTVSSSLKTNNTNKIGGINLISPNGKENWIPGTTHTIKWNSSGIPGPNVTIQLLKKGSVVEKIRPITLNDGSENWMISSALTPGTDYKIKITSASNPAYTDTSKNNFTISENLSLKINVSTVTAKKPLVGKIGVPLVSNGFEITVKGVTSSIINTNVGISIKNIENKEKPFKLGYGTVILDDNGQQYENIHPTRSSEISQANLSAKAIREGSVFFERFEDDRKANKLILNINEEKVEFKLDIPII